MSLTRILTVLRAGQLYYQAAHNLTKGETFLQDHGFLGEAYEAFAEAYDGVAERSVGLGEKPDLFKINEESAKISSGLKIEDLDGAFEQALEVEKSLVKEIEQVGKVSKGTDNLLAGIADESEVRIYKIQQRLG